MKNTVRQIHKYLDRFISLLCDLTALITFVFLVSLFFQVMMRYVFNHPIYGIDEATRRERIAKYAQLFEIESKLGDLVGSYSHGMCQKLALIGALIQQPKLLMLDEPFVGLDPKASHTLKEIMRELTETGTAIFFSTHVLEVAEKLCNRIAIIKNGRLIAAGPMEEVRGNQSLEELFLELTDA